jgi:hypothetical protein
MQTSQQRGDSETGENQKTKSIYSLAFVHFIMMAH